MKQNHRLAGRSSYTSQQQVVDCQGYEYLLCTLKTFKLICLISIFRIYTVVGIGSDRKNNKNLLLYSEI